MNKDRREQFQWTRIHFDNKLVPGRKDPLINRSICANCGDQTGPIYKFYGNNDNDDDVVIAHQHFLNNLIKSIFLNAEVNPYMNINRLKDSDKNNMNILSTFSSNIQK